MISKNFVKWMTMLSATVALVGTVAPGSAFAKSATVPTCNSWTVGTTSSPSVP